MIPTILLIAGHGGRDRANRGAGGYIEADGTLAISLAAGATLRAAGLRVIHDRTSDMDLAPARKYIKQLDLRARVEIGNLADAEIQVDIHTDAAPSGVRGVLGIYTQFGKFAGPSRRLADVVSRQIAERTGLPLRPLLTRRSTANDEYYATLRLAKDQRPSCIIECATHSDHRDEELLRQPTFLQEIGEAVARGILSYLGLPLRGDFPADKNGQVLVHVEGRTITGRLVDGITWVKLREYAEIHGDNVLWKGGNQVTIERGEKRA